MCLLVLGQISAGPQICPFIVGTAGTETQENGVLALILRILLQGLGHHVSLPGLRVLICAKAELDQMVP